MRFAIFNLAKRVEVITQQTLRSQFVMKRAHGLLQVPVGGGEEVRRNRSSFDFIISNGLWYKKGLAEAYKTKTAPISFPTGAMEVKAVWKKISKDSMNYYHWNYDETGTLYGLIALHIMTKAQPNWTWATWEWVGNPGRCDFLGCHDTYGASPANVNPNAKPNSGYPTGDLTPELTNLFKEYGISDEWKNYRLKGSQIDWIDQSGRTTLLGNSITEEGFVPTSSCITCHSVASFDVSGSPQPTIGFDTVTGQSQNGPVNPKNFWGNDPLTGKPAYMQGDFVWGLFKAH